jgi:hypothetical protein
MSVANERPGTGKKKDDIPFWGVVFLFVYLMQ